MSIVMNESEAADATDVATVIRLRDVSKRFGRTLAVDHLHLNVTRGSVYGLLGSNGAGKTTAIRMIVGHLHPSQGLVDVFGEDPWAHDETIRSKIAYISENMSLPGWMTVDDLLRFSERLHPCWNAQLAETLKIRFKLGGNSQRHGTRKNGTEKRRPFRNMSKGQKRLMCILAALCQMPELLVMDEPASGLDVSARREFLDQILEIACDGNRTVLISSHILSDLERVVDHVAIMHEGRMRMEGHLEDLKQNVRRLVFPGEIEKQDLADHFALLRYAFDGQCSEAVVVGFDEPAFQKFCTERGCGKAQSFSMNLENLFVEVTGEQN